MISSDLLVMAAQCTNHTQAQINSMMLPIMVKAL